MFEGTAEMASYYGISIQDLNRAAQTLRVGTGITSRFQTLDTDAFIRKAERWAEAAISEFIAVPLKAAPGRGETTIPDQVSPENFPIDFTEAIIFHAVARILNSEFFANEQNASSAAEYAEKTSENHAANMVSRTTTLVGAGRRRNANPMVPPNMTAFRDDSPRMVQ